MSHDGTELGAVRGDASRRASFDRVPLIDVGGLFAARAAERRAVAEAIDQAARQVGFLYVTGHGVKPECVSRLERAAAAFFALPEAAKRRYYIGQSSNHRGYVPPGEEVFYGQSKDSKEAFDLGLDLPPNDPDYRAGNRFLGPNVWPAELPEFRASVSAYYDAVLALGRRLLRGFALALGLPEEELAARVTKPPSQLRLIHYPIAPGGSGSISGIGAHTDYECFTILHTTAPGLEVMNADARFVDAPPVPGAFIVNIGDLFEVLSGGRWVSTTHRVRGVATERYSFPFFFNLDYDAVIEPLPAFRAQAGARYPRVLAGEHLLAQTIQSFGYLKRELAAGRLALPPNALGLSSFGRERAASREAR